MVSSNWQTSTFNLDTDPLIRWLVRKGRTEDAKRALEKLQSKHPAVDNDVDATVAMIAYTHKYEKDSESGAGYLDCFRGVDLRRTEITCMVWAIQNLSGSGFMGYSTVRGALPYQRCSAMLIL